MIEDFEFTIYSNLPKLEKDGQQWYVVPLYDFEFDYIKSIFKENTDFIIFNQWGMNQGFDVLIHSKIYTWLTLCYGMPNGDNFDHNIHNYITELQNKLHEI